MKNVNYNHTLKREPQLLLINKEASGLLFNYYHTELDIIPFDVSLASISQTGLSDSEGLIILARGS